MAAGVAADSALVLALHSTWDVVGAALLDGGELLAVRMLEGDRAAIRLASVLDRLVREAGRDLEQVSRLAVSIGPGSFTGIKVGLATAWGLSRALGIGIVGIGALEVLAAQASPDAAIAALLPAGRGELYVASFGPGRDRPVVLAPRLATPREAAELLAGAHAIQLGCGHLLDALGLAGSLEAEPGRLAADLGRLASSRAPLPPGAVPNPLYLRRTWAEEVREKRSSAQG